ncbi:MAG: TPM domain-containing protein [Hyphomicrobium sp.]|nr:TPM domain-containing protein [Hyphomicrobium sp.]
MAFISEQDQARIGQAIVAAERKTSGEIVAVLSGESASYLHVPFLWAGLIALIVPWPLVYLTWLPVQTIYLVQLATFMLILLLTLPRRVRYALVPQSVKRERAHRRAVEQFLVQNLHTTAGRTGVLIYVSVAERYAEIIADTGIDAKVPKGTWQAIVDDLTANIADGKAGDGFVHAVERSGDLLAKHFPPGTRDPNELPNHLIIIE